MPKTLNLFVSCEHGGNRVPSQYRHLFAGREAVLYTHRGYDIGILPFARAIAAYFGAPLLCSEITRLLVDLNRSKNSRTLFSEFSRDLPKTIRQQILQRYYRPYRQAAVDTLDAMLAAGGRVLHLSVHSFTPELNHQVRNADVGLLYDPARRAEKEFCLRWQQALVRCEPTLRLRRNYPYRGNADALVTALRKRYAAERYMGIELEINQSLPQERQALWNRLQERLPATLDTTLRQGAGPGPQTQSPG